MGEVGLSVCDIEQNQEHDREKMWKQVVNSQPEYKQIVLHPVGEFSGTWTLPVRLLIQLVFDNISRTCVYQCLSRKLPSL